MSALYYITFKNKRRIDETRCTESVLAWTNGVEGRHELFEPTESELKVKRTRIAITRPREHRKAKKSKKKKKKLVMMMLMIKDIKAFGLVCVSEYEREQNVCTVYTAHGTRQTAPFHVHISICSAVCQTWSMTYTTC